jgi:hypothetical protein
VITGQAEAGLHGDGQWRGRDGCCERHLHGDDPDASLPAQGRPLRCQRRDHGCGGNTATATQTLTLDRGTTVAITGVEGGDNTINAAEAAGGIVITARLRRVRRST